MRWLDSIIDSVDMNLGSLREEIPRRFELFKGLSVGPWVLGKNTVQGWPLVLLHVQER